MSTIGDAISVLHLNYCTLPQGAYRFPRKTNVLQSSDILCRNMAALFFNSLVPIPTDYTSIILKALCLFALNVMYLYVVSELNEGL
jgi:hypothetical protein